MNDTFLLKEQEVFQKLSKYVYIWISWYNSLEYIKGTQGYITYIPVLVFSFRKTKVTSLP